MKNHLHPGAQPFQRHRVHRDNVLPLNINMPGCGFFKADNRPRQGGLAAPGFTDNTKNFARGHAQRDTIHRPKVLDRPGSPQGQRPGYGKPDAQPVYIQQV
ncbi:MAG: hypothetical protein BWY09_02450 [Candidatus Hydrogenedentes bacterium ADurb.Bin179]|nr:MAG: hypothetical protein BWY09_02450 [Candidatus Hydrogenedentes bacterium ADurb.Bin179]